MATDSYKDELWNDGEGLDSADLNDARGFIGARLFDQLLAHMMGGPLASANPTLWGDHGGDSPSGGTVPLAFTLGVGDAYLWFDGVPQGELRIAPGTVFQKVAGKNGNEPTLLSYDIGASDFTFTVADNAAGNPRVDLIQIKLELVNTDVQSRDFKDAITGALTTTTPTKKRRVQATCNVKAGTPAATPTYPTPDAGFVALGAVYVTTGWTAAAGLTSAYGADAGIVQLSIPLNVRAIAVNPRDFDYSSGANWALVDGFAVASGAGADLVIPVPVASGRIVGISMSAAFVTSSAVQFGIVARGFGAFTFINYSTLTSVLGVVAAGADRHAGADDIADGDPISNPSGAGSFIGFPAWATGTPTPTGQIVPAALLVAGGSTSKVGRVIFWVAG